MLLAALLASALAVPSGAVPTFVQEPGIRLSSAVLQSGTVRQIPAVVGQHFYYTRGSTAAFSAQTADGGQSFSEDPGVRLSTSTPPVLAISSITGLSVLPLNAGGFRMLYAAVSTDTVGNNLYSILSAVSGDGLAWINDAGARVPAGARFVGFPSVVKLATGQWRLYYTQNVDGGTAPANRRIFTALSSDQGLTFGAGTQLSVSNSQAGEVAAIQRTDGRIRLYYTAPLAGSTTDSTILSALTAPADFDGSVFTLENGVRLSTDGTKGFLSAPYVVRSTETWRWKMYFNYAPFAAGVSTADVFSATTFAPDPASLNPSTVFQNNGVITFAIKGESFSGGAMGFFLSQGGTIVPGAMVSSTDDQTVSASFDTTNLSLGAWNLTVANANGFTGTLVNALNVTFLPGTAQVTDNLIRPRNGTKTRIDVMTFNAGPLAVKIYTLSGELLRALFDSVAPAGTTTVFWDGTTSADRTVASGAYLLKIVGQKVNSTQKIVVIK